MSCWSAKSVEDVGKGDDELGPLVHQPLPGGDVERRPDAFAPLRHIPRRVADVVRLQLEPPRQDESQRVHDRTRPRRSTTPFTPSTSSWLLPPNLACRSVVAQRNEPGVPQVILARPFQE